LVLGCGVPATWRAEARLSSQSGAAALPGSAPASASTRRNDYTLSFMTREDFTTVDVDYKKN